MGQKLGLKQIASLLDLSSSRILQLANQGIIPKDARGQYELVSSVRGYINYLRENSVVNVKSSMSLAEAKQRKLVAEAKLTELEYALEKGQVIRIDEVEPQWESLVIALKTKLLAIPSKATPLLVSQETMPYINKVLTDFISEALNELAKGTDVEFIEASDEIDPPEFNGEDVGEVGSSPDTES
jgi:phage terminase Nu1 subunit (DNA packaging protein)